MKKNLKKFILLLLLISISVMGITSTYASEYYPKNLTMSNSVMKTTPVKFPNTFYIKKSTDGEYVYCLSYLKKVPVSSVKYQETSLITDAGSNYILKQAYNAKSDVDHFVYQSALWIYLMDKGYMETSNTINTFKKTLNSDANTNEYAKKILNLIAQAKAQKSYDTKEPTISFGNGNVTFKLVGDYYVSSKIILNDSQSNTDYSNKLKVSSDISGVDYEINRKSGDDGNDGIYTYEMVVKVPKDKVAKKEVITISVSNSKTLYLSHKYEPANSAYQEMAKIFKVDKSANASLKLTVSPIKGKASISKQDATTGEEVEGAHLIVRDSDGNIVDEWDSTTTSHIITDLTPGVYTLEETIPPAGYILSSEKVSFTIKSDGSTTQVVMKNSPKEKVVTKVSISKQDATTGEEVEGAHLIVRNSDGNIVDEWDSTTTPHIITDLTPGVYTLEETIAPNGYVLSSEKITFTVKEDGSTTQVVMKNERDKDNPPEEIVVPSTGTYKSVVSSLIGVIVLIAGSVLITKNVKKCNEK